MRAPDILHPRHLSCLPQAQLSLFLGLGAQRILDLQGHLACPFFFTHTTSDVIF